MMQIPRIYADFNNSDAKGRIGLNCNGTLADLASQKIQLRDGLTLTLYSDDADDSGNPDELRAAATAQYSPDEQMWVAIIDWSALHHASDERSGAPQRHTV